jgi:hypothetical protein
VKSRSLSSERARQLDGFTPNESKSQQLFVAFSFAVTLIGGIATATLLSDLDSGWRLLGCVLGGLVCMIVSTVLSTLFVNAQTRKARLANGLDANDEGDPDILAN